MLKITPLPLMMLTPVNTPPTHPPHSRPPPPLPPRHAAPPPPPALPPAHSSARGRRRVAAFPHAPHPPRGGWGRLSPARPARPPHDPRSSPTQADRTAERLADLDRTIRRLSLLPPLYLPSTSLLPFRSRFCRGTAVPPWPQAAGDPFFGRCEAFSPSPYT